MCTPCSLRTVNNTQVGRCECQSIIPTKVAQLRGLQRSWHAKSQSPPLDIRGSLHTRHTLIRWGRSRRIRKLLHPVLAFDAFFFSLVHVLPFFSCFSFHFLACCTYFCQRYEASFPTRTLSVTPFRVSNFSSFTLQPTFVPDGT